MARALEVFTGQRDGSKRIDDRVGEEYVLDGMGASHLRLGDVLGALEQYPQALAIQKRPIASKTKESHHRKYPTLSSSRHS